MPDPIFTFFGLRENPFSINPDPRFLVLHPAAQAAWDDLLYGVSNRKGLSLLTGEVGTGKTTLVRALIDWLRSHKSPSALVVNSHLDTADLLDIVLGDFSILCPSNNRLEKLHALHRWLLQRFDARQLPVLILDEAQGLLPRVLEEIRLLLNLETSSSKLLQIVLAGQPELDQKLRTPEFSAIHQRIAVRCRTSPLRAGQTHQYVSERLRLAGASNPADVFLSETIDAIYHYSRGIPRVINLLCEHSLINARAAQRRPVPVEIVAEVARDFRCEPARPGAPHRPEPLLPGDSVIPPPNAPPPLWTPTPILGALSDFPADSLIPRANPLHATALPLLSAEVAAPPKFSSRHKFTAAEVLSSSISTASREVALPRPAAPVVKHSTQVSPSRRREPMLNSISAEVPLKTAPLSGQPLPWLDELRLLDLRVRSTLKRLARQTISQTLSLSAVCRRTLSSFARTCNRTVPLSAWLASFRCDCRRFAADVRRWLQMPVNSPPSTAPRARVERRSRDRRVTPSQASTDQRASTSRASH